MQNNDTMVKAIRVVWRSWACSFSAVLVELRAIDVAASRREESVVTPVLCRSRSNGIDGKSAQ